MYSNRFVISVLVNGQVQKEFANGEVHLPFGTEYSIRFRNKNDRRAVVKLFIDGEKMCRGGFVIPGNSYRDIECSSQTLRKFKFVDLQSTEAQDHGKDQTNAEKRMGLVEAHWYLEKEQPNVKEVHHHHHHPYPVPQPYPVYPQPRPWRPWEPYYGSTTECSVGSPPTAPLRSDLKCCTPPPVDRDSLKTCSLSDAAPPAEMDFDGGECLKGATSPRARQQYREICKSNTVRDGATVEGQLSNQRFGECNVDLEENATILKLYLRGYDPKVEENNELHVLEDTVADAQYCDRCGAKIAKKSSNFCHICGVKLHK